VEDEFKKVVILAETIKAAGNKKLIIVAGGSPTFPVHATHHNLECSPAHLYSGIGVTNIPFQINLLIMQHWW
jgi:hypothetical protein